MPVSLFGGHDPVYSGRLATPRKSTKKLWTPPGTSEPAPPVAFFEDSFTDTNAVLLQNHTSDSGHSYSKPNGFATNAIFASNRIYINGTGCRYLSSATPPGADYTVVAQVYIASQDFSGGGFIGLRGVTSTSSSYYGVYIFLNGASGWRIRLQRRLTGTDTDLATAYIADFGYSAVNGSTYELKISARGTTITAFWQGTQMAQATDSNLSAAGSVIVGGTAAAVGSNNNVLIDYMNAA